MEERKIVVVVEEGEEARTALKWALENILRYGDVLTLLHVFPYYSSSKSRNNKKLRLLRLKGYQLALSFKDICTSSSFNTKIEIVVTEDDEVGERIVGFVREVGAFALVLGLHDHSFIYRLAMSEGNNIPRTLNCKVLAIKQPRQLSTLTKISTNKSLSSFTTFNGLSNLDFSQIEIAPLQLPDLRPPKIPYQICPSPHGILWRSKKTRRRQRP